jgi:CRISPR-associated endonuclease Csn1
MIERILGIDLGIASLGWAVIEYDTEKGTYKIIDCGVRLFTAAETPKDHKSLNESRRNARGIRRVIKRRRLRMNKIKNLCISHNLLNNNDLNLENGLFYSKANRTDVWKLRHDALYQTLSPNELARVMIHIAKHRGFKFLGDDETDEESGKVKTAGKELKAKFETAGCLTIGEWIWRERQYNGKKRNRNIYDEKQKKKVPDYELSIHRDLLQYEIETIFTKQHSFGNSLASDRLLEAWKEIALFVRPMQSIEEMVGYCTFFPKNESKNLKGEKRAPKASPTAERFIALGKFFNTIVIDEHKIEKKLVELKSIEELMELARSKEKVTFKQLRKELGLNNAAVFKSVNDESKDWIKMSGNAAIKKVLSAEMYKKFINNTDIADEVTKILTYYKATSQKENELKKLFHGVVWMDEESIEELSKLSFSAFTQLSIKALKVLNKIMTDGYLRYDEAVRHALDEGLLPPKIDQKSKLLPPLKDTDIDILNPTVIRAFAQFRKVANALVKKYGSFDKVHFELAREVNTKEDRKRWEKDRDKNEKIHRQISDQLAEHGIKQNYKNVLKLKLRSEQKDICPYCQENLNFPAIFEDGYAQIDHILPLSRSQDDSYVNKVLVHTKCNQDKRNQTPYEWLSVNEKRWNAFKNFILSESSLGKRKKQYLLKENFGDTQSQNEFISRNINDTRYMSKAIKDYCKEYWQLNSDDSERIQVRSGKLTSALRHQWGLDTKNRETHTHHAADAIMIAFSTPSMVQKLSNYYRDKEIRREKEKPIFKAPMEHFREAVDKALSLERTEVISAKNGREIELHRLIISRPPRASVTGAAHKETIQSPRDYKGRGVSINDGKGMCDNGDMPRVDVFTKEGKYYLVPIYVADFAKEELPNKAIVAGKGKEWMEIDSSYSFLFSLHKEDLVQIQLKNEEPFIGYFKGAHSATAQVQIQSIDSDFVKIAGSKTAVIFKKYTIDPLGYYHEVKGEKRLGTIPQERKKRGSQGR